ncbi:DUF6377 domain-containing protein [Prevotella sp. 10(H)]|uniref:DUF6377 domain-containing protein n=1 Tax=Prevotella sp. 10(H) TaxID=1158294 RepID=UPI0004A6DA9F|nr:DUF6377 domain-containing protein [Prevotella sp. 10(H)]
MKALISFIILHLLFTAYCFGNERDDLLKELDKAIEMRRFYMDKKENRIDSLRSLLNSGLSMEERYLINNQIYKEYNTYRCDSAMRYVFYNKELADKTGIQKYKDETAINMSMLLSTTGMYRESIDNLRKIDRSRLDSSLLHEYYYISEWTYYEAGEYSNDSLYAPEYRRVERMYTDSVFSVLEKGTERYNYYKGKKLLQEGKLEDALNIFLSTYPTMRKDSRLYAIITYDIANIYNRFGSQDLYEKFLIMAAISDQVNPLKENLAGQELALYLFRNKPDDLDRAYRYIQCSMEDARFYNNRLRIVQISEKLPIIVEAYQAKIEREKSKITFALVAISLLSLITIALLAWVYKQMKLVKRNRKEVELLNKELSQMNNKLNEANHTKEEYVSLFIDLCSSYIDKLDKYREMVKRKLIAKQIYDLYKMVNSTRNIEMELDDFFDSFDNAFLKLYPTFIDEFNELLLPDEKVLPKKNELLNRELRIFALIRLGIDDSSRIASFMRYSAQTVYNNRTKVRNKAKDRDNFEKNVMDIGI